MFIGGGISVNGTTYPFSMVSIINWFAPIDFQKRRCLNKLPLTPLPISGKFSKKAICCTNYSNRSLKTESHGKYITYCSFELLS